jgi:hypothetical protein
MITGALARRLGPWRWLRFAAMSSVGDVGTDLHAGFAVALLRAMAPDADENVVVSPWSVSSALAVLAPGVEVRARPRDRTGVGGGYQHGRRRG